MNSMHMLHSDFTCVLLFKFFPCFEKSLITQSQKRSSRTGKHSTEVLNTSASTMPPGFFHRGEHHHYSTRDDRLEHSLFCKRARTSREPDGYDRRHQPEAYHAGREQVVSKDTGNKIVCSSSQPRASLSPIAHIS
jgi:hypothetical protein